MQIKKLNNFLIKLDSKKIDRIAMIWNLISSMLNAGMTAIFLFFVTKINGIEKAGAFSIASAYAYQCISLGNFGVRNFQASDVKYKYEYEDYVFLRIISSILMYLLLIYFSLFNGYALNKILIIISFGVFKSIDCYEDLVHGELQRNGRLDIANIFQSIRYFVIIIFFIITIILFKNLFVVCLISTIFTLFIFRLLNNNMLKRFVKPKIKCNKNKIKLLFFACLPICIGNAINMFIVNCPKYGIDKYLNDECQTYFAMLVLPVFTINLLSTVIYRPYVKTLGESWIEKNYLKFWKIIIKQIIIIFVLTVLICLFGYIIGLSLIEIIYGVDLKKYMFPFIVLLISGGLNSLSGYFSVVLTAMREQRKILIGFILSFMSAMCFSRLLILKKQIIGASYLACIVNLILSIIFILFIIMRFFKERRKQNG